MIWNGIIMAIFVNYLSIAVKSKTLIESKDGQPTNTWLGIVICIFALLYPMLATFFLRRNFDEMFINDTFIEKFSNWWLDIKIGKGKDMIFYYPFFLVKRYFIVLITVVAG